MKALRIREGRQVELNQLEECEKCRVIETIEKVLAYSINFNNV